MKDYPTVITWHGKDIESLSRDELVVAVKDLYQIYQRALSRQRGADLEFASYLKQRRDALERRLGAA